MKGVHLGETIHETRTVIVICGAVLSQYTTTKSSKRLAIGICSAEASAAMP